MKLKTSDLYQEPPKSFFINEQHNGVIFKINIIVARAEEF